MIAQNLAQLALGRARICGVGVSEARGQARQADRRGHARRTPATVSTRIQQALFSALRIALPARLCQPAIGDENRGKYTAASHKFRDARAGRKPRPATRKPWLRPEDARRSRHRRESHKDHRRGLRAAKGDTELHRAQRLDPKFQDAGPEQPRLRGDRRQNSLRMTVCRSGRAECPSHAIAP